MMPESKKPQVAVYYNTGLGSMEDNRVLLDEYVQKEGIVPEHSYYVDDGSPQPSNSVMERFLRDAALGHFDTLLVKSFDQLPPLDETRLPRLRIISLEEQEIRELGILDQPLPTEDVEPAISKAAIYCRRGHEHEDDPHFNTIETPSV